MTSFLLCLLAQAAGGEAIPDGEKAVPNSFAAFQPMIFFGIVLFMFWFLMLRPAHKQEKERKKAIYQLKKGDEVTFSGGILGTVTAIKEKKAGTPGDQDEIIVKVLESKLRILRSSIYSINPVSEGSTQEPAST